MSDPVHPRTGGSGDSLGDLAREVPDAPPPRPAAKAEALAAALRRFDGVTEAPAPLPARPSPPRDWWRSGRSQVGALAAMALVAVIAVPLALEHPDGHIATPPPAATTAVADTIANAPPPTAGVAAPQPAPADPTKPLAPPASSPAAAASTGAPERDAEEAAPAASTPLAPPPMEAAPPPPPPPPAPMAPAPMVAEAPAPSPEPAQRAALADNSDVVVTGSRVSRRAKAAARRGDWNRCTVLDPERRLDGCGGLIRVGAKGAAGAAGAEVAQGLALGWREDWDGAVAAFGRAIALQPRLGIAYLNRGLAQQRLDASEQALADLDRAVRYAPTARSYYARSKLRRERGDLRGAQADEDRAVQIDSDYERLVED